MILKKHIVLNSFNIVFNRNERKSDKFSTVQINTRYRFVIKMSSVAINIKMPEVSQTLKSGGAAYKTAAEVLRARSPKQGMGQSPIRRSRQGTAHTPRKK